MKMGNWKVEVRLVYVTSNKIMVCVYMPDNQSLLPFSVQTFNRFIGTFCEPLFTYNGSTFVAIYSNKEQAKHVVDIIEVYFSGAFYYNENLEVIQETAKAVVTKDLKKNIEIKVKQIFIGKNEHYLIQDIQGIEEKESLPTEYLRSKLHVKMDGHFLLDANDDTLLIIGCPIQREDFMIVLEKIKIAKKELQACRGGLDCLSDNTVKTFWL